ncbi:MAG: VWA domain-containing protein [Pseudomonadota bacterium]|nr:VWA domain-containing protein [Pseudomonadota bacterium]
MSIAFAWPWALAALPLPLIAYFLVPRAEQHPGTALRIPFFNALAAAEQDPFRPRRWRTAVGVLAWLLLVAAATRPQILGDPVPLPVQGRDLMLAVDISGSMVEEDMVIGNRVVDRLTAVKAVAGDFMDRREGDRIGLILFGTQAYQQTPLTFDRTTARTLLFESAVGLAGRETAIGDAIGLAVKRLRDEAAENRILILLTDGANTAGRIDPMKAAELAAAEGVRIYGIGVGSEGRRAFGLALGGARIDETTLLAIARTTNGRYFRARDVEDLQKIYGMLDELEPVVSDEQTFRPVDELFEWPLGSALLLSILLGLGRVAVPQLLSSLRTTPKQAPASASPGKGAG